MKRSFAALMLLLIPALMTSCWKTGEDWSLCGVDDNFVLKFRVQDGTDLTFQKDIKSVDVFLFNADKLFLEHKNVDKSELTEFKGVTFTVTPGTYYVVCWANVDSYSRMSAMDGNSNYENSYIEIVKPNDGPATTGSPIYYAPYKIPVTRSGFSGLTRADDDYSIYSVEVLANKETVKELTFAKVHRSVQVYVKGYENTDLYDGKSPVVKQTNDGGKYNFLLHADLTPFNLEQPSVFDLTEDGEMYAAEFFSALIPVRDDMFVYLYHPTQGNILATVNLEQFIAKNKITDDSLIAIMLTFDPFDASVSISMPSWMDNPIVPDL